MILRGARWPNGQGAGLKTKRPRFKPRRGANRGPEKKEGRAQNDVPKSGRHKIFFPSHFRGAGGREKNARRTKNEEREVLIRLLQRRALETTISQNLKRKCVPCCLAKMCKSGPPFGTAWRSQNWEATSRLAVCRAPPWGIGKRLSS